MEKYDYQRIVYIEDICKWPRMILIKFQMTQILINCNKWIRDETIQ